jgi:hypothetical protein
MKAAFHGQTIREGRLQNGFGGSKEWNKNSNWPQR